MKFLMKTVCVNLCYSISSEILNLNWTYVIMLHTCISILPGPFSCISVSAGIVAGPARRAC